MATRRLLASSRRRPRTSASRCCPTLEVFSRLDLRDIDLNLHHILEEGVAVESVADLAAARGLRVWVVSGGWCDFFQGAPQATRPIGRWRARSTSPTSLGAAQLRLFFGRLKYEDYSPRALETVVPRTCGACPTGTPTCRFIFENHDGASLHPEVCRDILERVDRPNIRMNFDPINFERAGVNSMARARHRARGRRPRAPQGPRPRRVLRVRRRRRRSAAGAAGARSSTVIGAGSRSNTKGRTTGRFDCIRVWRERDRPSGPCKS